MVVIQSKRLRRGLDRRSIVAVVVKQAVNIDRIERVLGAQRIARVIAKLFAHPRAMRFRPRAASRVKQGGCRERPRPSR